MKHRKEEKNFNPNMHPETITKTESYLQALHHEAYLFFPGQKEWRERLIFTMFKWLKDNPKSLTTEEFLEEYQIPYDTFRKWELRYPDLGRAVKVLKKTLAGRRKVGVMRDGLNYAACYKDMHTYDDEWSKEVNHYYNDLEISKAVAIKKQLEEDTKQPIHVYVDSVKVSKDNG